MYKFIVIIQLKAGYLSSLFPTAEAGGFYGALHKTHLALWFPISQGNANFDHLGYYFHLESGNQMLGAGIHGFSKPLLKAYRDAVINPNQDPSLTQAITTDTQKDYSLGEKTYNRILRGYDPDTSWLSFCFTAA